MTGSNQGTPPPEPAAPGDDAFRARLEAQQQAESEQATAVQLEAERESERLRFEQALREADAVGGRAHQGLVLWTAIVFLGALAGFLAQRPEAPLFLTIAGLFALTQSWDSRDRARTGHPALDAPLAPGDLGAALRVGVPLVVPALGVLFYVGLGVYTQRIEHSAAHALAAKWCFGATAVCALMAVPRIRRSIASRLMGSPPTQTAQLATSIAVLALLLPVPIRLLWDDFMNAMPKDGKPLVDPAGLMVQLACELLFAAAAVGLWVSRDPRAVRDRLGLHAMRGRDWLIAALGLVAVILLNAGMEWLERTHFHALWLADQAIVRAMVGEISVAGAVVLGLSAGAGEEILVRGALQPRAGVFWASVLFAMAHVQYTWFGMLTILFLGIALGLIRRWSNTTTAIAVHMLYDVVAALGAS